MVPLHIQLANSTLRCVIKRLHFPLEIRLPCVRWCAAYPLSLRNLEEVMAERSVPTSAKTRLSSPIADEQLPVPSREQHALAL
jgi:hypothetical protein